MLRLTQGEAMIHSACIYTSQMFTMCISRNAYLTKREALLYRFLLAALTVSMIMLTALMIKAHFLAIIVAVVFIALLICTVRTDLTLDELAKARWSMMMLYVGLTPQSS